MKMEHTSTASQKAYQALLRKNKIQERDIGDFFQQLLSDLPKDADSFQKWLDRWDSFMGEIQDAQNVHYFQYLGSLDDPALLQSYQQFLQKSQAAIAAHEPALTAALQKMQAWHALLPDSYQAFVSQQLRLSAKDPESARLRASLQQTAGKHPQRLMAARIEFAGKKNSPQEIAAIMKAPDRGSREAAWHATNAARRADTTFFQELFEEQLMLRNQLALAAGKADYVQLRFEELDRTAYQPEDCLHFHQLMAKHLPAFQTAMYQAHKQEMQWEEMYPWDLACGPPTPMVQHQEEPDLMHALSAFMKKLQAEWASHFDRMRASERLDLLSRPGKMMGAMTYQMKQDRLPLVMAAYEGSPQGLTQVIHELGHATHFVLGHGQALKSLRPIPPEAGELVALTFELLGLSHSDLFFGDAAAQQQVVKTQLYRIFSLLALTLALDAFQHEVYRHPEMTAEARNACWKQQYLRFHGDEVRWTPFEEELSQHWLRHFHLFEAPFYSIEYAIAQLGALQIWQQYQQNPVNTIEKLDQMMKQAFSKSVPELYHELGLSLFPSADSIHQLLSFCLTPFTSPNPPIC